MIVQVDTLIRRFGRSQSGATAPIVAVALVPIVALVGAAIDYTGAATRQTALQKASDAAVLVGCKSTTADTTLLKTEVTNALQGLMGSETVTVDTFTPTNSPRSITMDAHISYQPKLFSFGTGSPVTIKAQTACATSERFYEIALVLDTTGSMNDSAGTTTKIAAMRTAAKNFVTSMYKTFDTTHLKISLVPFAAAVRVDPATYAPSGTPLSTATWIDSGGRSPVHWQNVANASASSFTSRFDIFKKLSAVRSSWAWTGCFESLAYPYNTQDAPPSTATPGTLHVPLFAPDEEGTELFRFLGTSFQDVSWPASVNSYIDDGNPGSATCNAFGGDADRMSRACKYVTPRTPQSSMNGPNWGCTSQALQRLSTNATSLTTQIDSLSASGQTNLAEGLHWGWQTLSPNGAFNDGAAYTNALTTKIVILMTDGVNTWNANSDHWVTGSDYSTFGYFRNADGSNTSLRLPSAYANLTSSQDARNAMDQLVRETCTNMKNKKIELYTVAFSTPDDAIDATGRALLSECATDATHALTASNASTLNETFEKLAKAIGAMRITR